MTIYIYVKTHKITGLKYLGKTEQNPHEYKGSGEYWKRHLNVHGSDVDTEILKECQSNEEVQKWGLYYSELWDIVRSDNWANQKPENGDGGSKPGHLKGKSKPQVSKNNRKRLGELHPMYGKKRPDLSFRNANNTGEKNPMFGKVSAMRGKKNPALTELNKKKTGKNNPMCKPEYQITCEYCNKTVSKGNFVRWHGTKCKLNKS